MPLVTEAHPQSASPPDNLMPILTLNKLQQLLNSGQVTIQAATEHNGIGKSMVHITVALVDGTSLSLALPGQETTSETPIPQQHMRIEGNQAETQTNTVYTINNQLIRKVYIRRRPRKEASTTSTRIFAEFEPDYCLPTPTTVRKVTSKKRTIVQTPVSDGHLRRSKRSQTTLDGHKPEIKGTASGPITRSKAKARIIASPGPSNEGGHGKMWSTSFGGDPGAAAC